MKQTLLELVQGVLANTSGDQVNSISDTVESNDIAMFFREVYENLVVEYDLPAKRQLVQLDASTDPLKPTHMRMPVTVRKIEEIKYDRRTSNTDPLRFDDLHYKSPKDFLDFVLARNSQDTNVSTITDYTGVRFLIRKDTPPTYWTSFDDTYVIFDSYDIDLEATVQQSKTICYASVGGTWTMTNAYVPDLPEHLFPVLKAETTSKASIRAKQTQDGPAERDSRRIRIAHTKRTHRAGENPYPYPNYGRK